MQLRRFRISMILQGLPAIVRASEVVSGHLLQIAGSLAFVKFAYIFRTCLWRQELRFAWIGRLDILHQSRV